jgi:hypothetical protein
MSDKARENAEKLVQEICDRLRGVNLTSSEAERIREAVKFSDRLPDQN